MTDVVAMAAVALAVAVIGGVLGMLLVPRIERMTEPTDEESGAGDDPDRN